MRRIAWLTDIHLNFIGDGQVSRFLDSLARARPDVVLLGGDIAEAPELSRYLTQLVRALAAPVYLVLGNHDFYFGSIAGARDSVRRLAAECSRLVYLTDARSVIELTPRVGLVGHDGWADARLGDYRRSLVMMNDYKLIAELSGYDKQTRLPHLQALGDETAEHFRNVLPAALDRYEHVFVLTHVPPFREACWHEGQISNDEWLPHFTCEVAGTTLSEIARDYPDRQLTVLCGHTHGSGTCRPVPNLEVITGGAQYGHPEIQRVFELA